MTHMAESAGIINNDGPNDDRAFRHIVAGAAPEIQELAHAVRSLVYDVLPQTVEVVWPKQGSVGWGTGPKKFSEQFAYLMPFKQHVTLGFYYGGELPDPAGLLPTAGGRQVSGRLAMRSMKLTTLEQVRQPALRALLHDAVRHRVPAPSGEN
jgi:signal recognition particle subunit SEC65